MNITLSRQLGSEGDTIAARVAAALGMTLADREYVHRASLAAGIPEELLHRLMYERQRSMAAEIMESLGTPQPPGTQPPPASSPLLSIFAPMVPPRTLSLQDAARSVGLVIKDLASSGNMLILGQGAQVLLRGYAGTCHVQVIAPVAQRIARVAAREKIPSAMARRLVRDSDLARSDYLARFYNAHWLDPLLYHLVINTGQTSIEAAVTLVAHAAQATAGTARQ